MSDYRFGDVVLIDFPFADRTAEKRRPGLIVSQDSHGDLLIARISSKLPEVPTDVALHDWKNEGLNIPSAVRLLKLMTTNEAYVLRKLGRLSVSDRHSVVLAFTGFVQSLDKAA